MIFENLFLERADLTRLDLYRDILAMQKPVFKVSELSKLHNTSYQQTYNNLQSLLRELKNYSEVDVKEYFDGTDIYQDNFTMSLSEFRSKVISNTLGFSFIDALVNNKFDDLSSFLSAKYISRSTLSRKISTLHDYMKNYNIGISYIDMKFVGDEKKIREFIFILYYSLFVGIKWPFEEVSYEAAADFVKLVNNEFFNYLYRNKVDEQQCIFKTAITLTRIKDHYPVSRAKRLDVLVENNNFFNVNKAVKAELIDLPVNYSFNELENLYFSFNETLSPFIDPNVNDRNFIENFKDNDNSIWQFTIKYLEVIANNYSDKLAMEVLQNDVVLANLLRIFYSSYVFMGKYPSFSQLYIDQADIKVNGYNKLISITEQFISESAFDYELNDLIMNSKWIGSEIFDLFLPIISKLQTKDVVQIKLYLEEDLTTSRDLISFLSDLNGLNILPESAPVEEADLIITPLGHLDNLPNIVIPDDIPIIFWNNLANESEFYRIYQAIKSFDIVRTSEDSVDLSEKSKDIKLA